ncbi:MAG: hypothetical protein ACFE8B_02260 [Candidatus Hermodarchaeota archaeon]
MKKWLFALEIFGCIQFIIITAIAMGFYKGGTYIDSTTSNYLFWNNYFSDLGRTIAHSGLPNTISFILFTITLSLWGLLQIPFYLMLPSLFKDLKRIKKFAITGSILGVFTGIFYVGIAFTPSDVTNLAHNIFVFLGFSSIFLSIIFYAIVTFKDKSYSNLYAITFTISAIILGNYFMILAFIPNSLTTIGLYIYVVGQKFMIYTLLICGIIQGIGAIKQYALSFILQ